MTKLRYAAHYLRIGRKQVANPLLTLYADGKCSLELFSHEVERTIFCNGTIVLYNDAYPLDLLSPSIDVSQEDLFKIIAQSNHWLFYCPQI